MTIVLSHASALECMRMKGSTACFASDERESFMLPAMAPTHRELEYVDGWNSLAELTRPVHVLVGETRGKRVTRKICAHPSTAPHGVVHVCNDIYCVPPETVALQLAPQCTEVELAMLLMELAGVYAVCPSEASGMFTRTQPLTSMERLESALQVRGNLRGTSRVRELLPTIAPGSASPMESRLFIRMSWSPAKGGFGLPVVGLNYMWKTRRMETGETARRYLDLLLGTEGGPLVDLEYNGSLHLEEERAAQDMMRQNDLSATGVLQFAIGKRQYDNLAYMERLARMIRQRLHVPSPSSDPSRCRLEHELRALLYRELERADSLRCFGL